MIEAIVIKYLKKRLPGESITAEVPRGVPERFITVERTGSRQLNTGLFESTVAVQSWELSKYKAAELSALVCDLMREIADYEPSVTKARGSDYDFTDTETKRYRYQAVFTLTHY